MRGYLPSWDDFVDCWSSPVQCFKAATGAGSSAPLDETTSADIAYRRMKMPQATPEEIGVPTPAPPPFEPEPCAAGYILDSRTGQCAKIVAPRPAPGTPGGAGQDKQQYLILALAVGFVGLALFVALRRRV